jgi:hypothetical protein
MTTTHHRENQPSRTEAAEQHGEPNRELEHSSAFRMRRAPTALDETPEPPELLQPTYPDGILPMLVMKATGDAHAPIDDPARYPPPPPPPDEIASGQEPIVPVDGGGAEPAAPVNVTVPAVTQAADVLSCTMGTWTGEPTSYAYQWQLDGVDAGTDADSYTVTAGDIGKSATCVVTATNGLGSTAAPPSNAIVVA